MRNFAGTFRRVLRVFDNSEYICRGGPNARGMEELAVCCVELGCGAVVIVGYSGSKLLGWWRKREAGLYLHFITTTDVQRQNHSEWILLTILIAILHAHP